MAKMIFVNLPVSDLARSTAFYEAIGGEKNPQFTDDTASCMVFSETIYVMLLTHDKFGQFTSKKIADAKATSEVLICLSADSRDAVDDMVAKAPRRGRRRRSGPEAGLRLHVRPQLRGSGRPHLGSDVDGCCGRDRCTVCRLNCLRLQELRHVAAQGVFVGWAKRSVPTIHNRDAESGGHGAERLCLPYVPNTLCLITTRNPRPP